jgi:hypothetical protein
MLDWGCNRGEDGGFFADPVQDDLCQRHASDGVMMMMMDYDDEAFSDVTTATSAGAHYVSRLHFPWTLTVQFLAC